MKQKTAAFRLTAVLLVLTLCLSGCLPFSLLPVIPTVPETESAAPPVPTVPPVPTQSTQPTDPVPTETEPTQTAPLPETTEPTETTEPNTDPEDEALIRWQNYGQKDYLPDGPVQMVPFSQMEYIHPDTETLYADFDELTARAKTSSDTDDLLESFYALYTRYVSFYSMDALANVKYSLDTTDTVMKQEFDFCEAEMPNLEEKLEALNKAFAASPARKDLEKKYFGEGYFLKFDDYEVYTNPEYLRLSQEEAALKAEYRDLTSELLVSYDDETKTLDEWLEADSYSVYIGALKAYYEQYNSRIGDVYVRLVKVRQQLAKALEYDSYAAYSYDMEYERDYTPEQGKQFLSEIREYLLPVMEMAQNNRALSRLSVGSATESQMKQMLRSAAENLGGTVWDAYRFMETYELYDISKSSKKIDASFQTYLQDYEAPFLLVNAKGSGTDYSTFAHEFGHYVDSYYNYGANEDIETAETFSQAMEFLALSYNDTLSEKQRSDLLQYGLYDMLETFVYQGAYADFEERVYALPENEITIEKINDIYRQVCKDYNVYEDGFDFYYSQSWIDVLHFFEVPYYIISYCVSAETALQVYQLEAAHNGDGVDAYFRLLDRDYEAGIRQVMQDALMEDPFGEDVLKTTADLFIDKLRLN